MPVASARLLGLAALLTAALLVGRTRPAAAENWPQWRGPDHDGTSHETDLPVAWSEQSGLVWKCRLPEWGDSTPVIWGDAIFLTSHVEDEKLLLLKINAKTGRIEWTRQVGTGTADRAPPGKKSGDWRGRQVFHATQNLATPSAVTDGELVICHFGNGDLAAYDFQGNRLWHRNLQEDHGRYTIWWGHANSPVLYEDLVISACMQDSCKDVPGGPSPSYLVAHRKRTGTRKWLLMRPTDAPAECADSYTTPVLHRTEAGVEMIVMGGQILDAYDPATGRRLWHLDGLVGNRVIPSPVVARGAVFATQGMRRDLLAVRLGGRGELSRKDVVWKCEQGTSDSPTPVVWGNLLFMVSNNGVARCLDAETGRLYWKQRLKGGYRASPLAADERIYFLNMTGRTTVVAASSRYDRLTENELNDQTVATPAVSGKRIFIRGHKWLYCVGR